MKYRSIVRFIRGRGDDDRRPAENSSSATPAPSMTAVFAARAANDQQPSATLKDAGVPVTATEQRRAVVGEPLGL